MKNYLYLILLMPFLLSACGQDETGEPAAKQVREEIEATENVIQQKDIDEETFEVVEPTEADNYIPRFEDYPVELSEFKATKTIDLEGSTYKDATYKNLLLNASTGNANLANHYQYFSVSCGANCQTYFIINRKTGRIIDDIGATLSLQTRLDSSLIIADPYLLPIDQPFYSNPLVDTMRFYVLKDNKIELIKTLSHREYYNLKKTEE